jgi:Fur family ferric uptake transcriptional regulator
VTLTASHTATPAASASNAADAMAALRARGLRASSARRLVIEAVYAAEEPVTAERIAGGLDGRFPPSDLASVYRNLETLEQHGLVRHFHLGHGPGRYVPAGEPREYLACENCGSVRAVDRRALAAVREYVRRRFALSASFSHFPIVGRCASCSAPDQEAP